MKSFYFFLLLICLVAIAVAVHQINKRYLYTELNEKDLLVPTKFFPNSWEDGIKVASMGDLHVSQTESGYDHLSSLVQQILASNPDVILLLGDYTTSPASVPQMSNHRLEIAKRISPLTKLPTFAVLGNYETWSGAEDWTWALSQEGATVLQNDVILSEIKGKKVCIRGLGDAFTNQLSMVDFPDECDDFPRITITHDPAGALKAGISGLIFAAHTHCGQIRLPVFGTLWTPTEAPQSATCGLYEDNKRMLWVTAGVGTSVLPVRLGAQSQWDLMTLK